MTNYAKIGGILSIISGGFSILWLIMAVLMMVMMWSFTNPAYYDFRNAPPGNVMTIMMVFYGVMAFIGLLVGALAVVGGIYGIRKKIWGLALAGAIAGTLVFFPAGIVAIIFTALGKPEYDTVPAAVTAPVQT